MINITITDSSAFELTPLQTFETLDSSLFKYNRTQFPVYLIKGDNGQLGIDLYNWLEINLDNWNPDTQKIYIDNVSMDNISCVPKESSSTGELYFYIYSSTIHGMMHKLEFNGYVTYVGAGSND